MKKILISTSLLAVIILMGKICLAEMVAPNYKITSDVIGSFGSKESSASFELGDTGGEVGTGDFGSTNFNLAAGFWGEERKERAMALLLLHLFPFPSFRRS